MNGIRAARSRARNSVLALILAVAAQGVMQAREPVSAALFARAARLQALCASLSNLQSPATSLALLIASLLLLGSACLLRHARRENAAPATTLRAAPRGPDRLLYAIGASLAGALALFVSQLRTERSAVCLGAWVAVQLLLLALGFALDRRPGIQKPTVSRSELALVAIAVCAACALAAHDLDAWKYSCIGDEWGVYDKAEYFSTHLETGSVFLEVSDGVYGVHSPYLTFLQSVVMRVAGRDNFGWRLSAVLAHGAALAFSYVVARCLLGRTAALAALALLSVSHSMLADAHLGYGWGLARAAMLGCFAALAVLGTSESLTAAAAVGIAAAHCRLLQSLCDIALPIAALGVLALVRRRRAEGRPVAAMLGLTIGSYAATAEIGLWAFRRPTPFGGLLWKTSLAPLITHYLGPYWGSTPVFTDQSPGVFLARLGELAFLSFFAPLGHFASEPYAFGPLMDPVTSTLAILGIFVAVVAPDPGRRSVLGAFAAVFAAAALLIPFHEYNNLRLTRLTFLVPLWGLFAGMAFAAIADGFGGIRGGRTARAILASTVLVLAAGWNLRQFYRVMPRSLTPAPISLAIRLADEEPSRKLLLCGEGWNPDQPALHYPASSRIAFLPTRTVFTSTDWPAVCRGRDLVFTSEYLDRCGVVADWMRTRVPTGDRTEHFDRPGSVSLVSFDAPEAGERPLDGPRHETLVHGALHEIGAPGCSGSFRRLEPQEDPPLRRLAPEAHELWLTYGGEMFVLGPPDRSILSLKARAVGARLRDAEPELRMAVDLDGRAADGSPFPLSRQMRAIQVDLCGVRVVRLSIEDQQRPPTRPLAVLLVDPAVAPAL